MMHLRCYIYVFARYTAHIITKFSQAQEVCIQMIQEKQTKSLEQKKRLRQKRKIRKIKQLLHFCVTFGALATAIFFLTHFILLSLNKSEQIEKQQSKTIFVDNTFHSSDINTTQTLSSQEDLLSSIMEVDIESIEQAQTVISNYALLHKHSIEEYPQQLIELFVKNKDARSFVLDYPEKKNDNPIIDLSECASSDSVPLLMQWDPRWGYLNYAGNVMGLTGCGPTCLSMVALYLTHDASLTPEYIAKFSKENGYSIDGSGSAWTLISRGGRKLGMKITEIPLDYDRMINNLSFGYPIICILGPGDFTDSGHFIVITGYNENGEFTINDPNSYERSQKTWSFEQLRYQIRNLWVCQKRR